MLSVSPMPLPSSPKPCWAICMCFASEVHALCAQYLQRYLDNNHKTPPPRFKYFSGFSVLVGITVMIIINNGMTKALKE